MRAFRLRRAAEGCGWIHNCRYLFLYNAFMKRMGRRLQGYRVRAENDLFGPVLIKMIAFNHVFLPFCLRQLAGDTYVVLNRNLKPVGLTAEGRIRYDDHPVRIRVKGLTPELVARLSCGGSTEADQIFLYDASCAPGDGAIHAAAYAARLHLLSELAIEAEESASRYVEVPGFPTFLAR